MLTRTAATRQTTPEPDSRTNLVLRSRRSGGSPAGGRMSRGLTVRRNAGDGLPSSPAQAAEPSTPPFLKSSLSAASVAAPDARQPLAPYLASADFALAPAYRQERVLRRCGGEPCTDCDHDEGPLRRGQGNATPGLAPPEVHDVLGSAGSPLDAGARALMEPRFGKDFSGVRVHTDARAAASANAVRARAYTVGSHIAFAAGAYSPATPLGQRLLAHELTHTIQQQGRGDARCARQLKVGDVDDPAEHEADHIAEQILKTPRQAAPHGGRPALRTPPMTNVGLQRQTATTPPPAGPYTGYQSFPPTPPPRPCHVDPECSKPIAGSSWDFNHQVQAAEKKEEQEQKADPGRAQAAGAPGPAANVTDFVNKKRPGAFTGVSIRIDPLKASGSAGGTASDCQGHAPQAGQPACIEVPKAMDDEARSYNTTNSETIGSRSRLAWETWTLGVLVHENEHIKFASAPPVGRRPTMNTQAVYLYSPEIFEAELDELNALLTEYPIWYQSFMASTNIAAADKVKAIRDWIGKYAIANGQEDIRGMLTKLRCVSLCQDVNDAVTKIYQAQSTAWTQEQKDLFVAEVRDPKYKLDWPTK
jgi:Domain of unknown function (DUF4157)